MLFSTKAEYGVRLMQWEDLPRADAIVAAVAHKRFKQMPADEICRKVIKAGCVVDVKSGLDDAALQNLGLTVWRL